MAKRHPREDLTILEAVDHLSNIAELDVNRGQEEGLRWLDPEQKEENRAVIKETFRVLHNYLQHIYKKNKRVLKEPDMQRGIQAMMVLAGEAAQKLDKYTSLFKGTREKEGAAALKEYQDLRQFYLTKIMKRLQTVLDTEEAWQAEWGGERTDPFQIEKRGLRDLETVRRDKEYELFYIQKEDGMPFFNKNLLRHIKLVGDFDESLADPAGEDPFLKIKIIEDRDLHASAQEILDLAASSMGEFYKEAMHHKELELIADLNKSLMALMLAANPQNLLQNRSGKCSLSYYQDFHHFLREALHSSEYQKLALLSKEELDPFFSTVMHLAQALCCFFFTRIGARRDAIAFIHRLGGEVPTEKKIKSSPLSVWDHLLDEDEQIRYLLKHYPNGPLLKTLDVLKQGATHSGFDPLGQENLPSHLYTIKDHENHVTVMRLPSPTHQKSIHQVEVIDEFSEFLHFTGSHRSGQRYLLVNMQDRTSWREHARCTFLEKLQNEARYRDSLFVITLPKATDFYAQSSLYRELKDAHAFKNQFKEQITSEEQCGYYFPSPLKTVELNEFVDEALEKIHHHCFSSQPELSRKDRLAFIEIFYHLFVLKWIDWLHPDSMSFTCKDAIDTGAAATASFFAFLRLLSDPSPFTHEEMDLLIWMFYAPALMIRERAIDIQALSRAVSALAHFHAQLQSKRTEILEAFATLYSHLSLKGMAVQEATLAA
jgi:hypothetical protein